MTSNTTPTELAAEVNLPPFTADDVPLWLEEKLGADLPFYVTQRNEIIVQVQREARLAGDWLNLAAGYLSTVGDNSPPFGGLHHTLNIIAAAIRASLTPATDERLAELLEEARTLVTALAMYDGSAPLENRFVSVPAVVARRAKAALARIDAELGRAG